MNIKHQYRTLFETVLADYGVANLHSLSGNQQTEFRSVLKASWKALIDQHKSLKEKQ